MGALYFATSNRNKVVEAEHILKRKVVPLRAEIHEIQALGCREVAVDKAQRAYQQFRKPIFVEDTAVHFAALGGFPGALIKWLFEAVGDEGICRLLDRYDDRSALTETCVCYYSKHGPVVFRGKAAGAITEEPRGEKRFAWDRIFVPEGHTQTYAEMGLAEKSKVSARYKAFLNFRRYLDCEGL